MEAPGIDPGTSRMLSERSTIWATPPIQIQLLFSNFLIIIFFYTSYKAQSRINVIYQRCRYIYDGIQRARQDTRSSNHKKTLSSYVATHLTFVCSCNASFATDDVSNATHRDKNA